MHVQDASRKRARTEDATKKAESRLYAPYRSIGHITNQVPFDIQIKGTQFLLTTCIGRSVQTYDCAKLNLLFVSAPLEHDIVAIKSQSDLLLVASGSYVVALKRGKEKWRLDAGSTITQLETFGNYICAATKESIVVFADGEQYTEIARPNVTCMLHPATYLNKIVIAVGDNLELWNVRTGQLIHTTKIGIISSISASPVIDVIAVGLRDGTIIVHHLRADETMIELHQQGAVTSISFRTDGSQIMATANDQGEIALWDLEKSRLNHVLRTAHDGSVSAVQFLNGQPLMISTGSDNAVREWIFDSLDGSARLLRSRTGHHAAPSTIQFYGDSSHFLISASRDRAVIGFSVYRDAQTTELSQGAVQSQAKKTQTKASDLKLPEIVDVAWSNTREKDWDNILTAHKDDSAARSWNWLKRKLGSHVLRTSDKSAVRSVAISACTNFGFIGSYRGSIDCYNMQSGLHRRTYTGHTKAVCGITSDAVNKVLVSCSLDGMVKFWNFQTAQEISSHDLQIGVIALQHHRNSGLIALTCDDFVVRVVDIETKKVVRELWGHTNRITSTAFSNDGRWLVTASLDGIIRTFDLPTGHTIDAIKTPAVCTALSFSPTGDYLATAHIDSVGINLWSNKSQFTAISTRNIENDIQVEMPSASGIGGVGLVELALAEEDEDSKNDVIMDKFTTVDQLSTDLLTMSLVPKTKWQTLLNLETIRERNKPKEAPKAPEKLPFDLGTLRDLQKGVMPTSQEEPTTRHLPVSGLSLDSTFSQLLIEKDFDGLHTHLTTLGPAQLDIAIRSLSPDHDFIEMLNFIEALTLRLRQRRDYELCQTYFSTFLKAHSELIRDNLDIMDSSLREWREVQELERARLSDLVGYCNGVLKFLILG